MTLLTINEKVVIRVLENAAMIYRDLPTERPGEASEFRAALDLAIAVIKARPVHREAAGIDPVIVQPGFKVIAGGARPRKKKGPAEAATSPSHGSTKSPARKTA